MFNHGGTISVSRYALWYVPFFGWPLAGLLAAWPARLGRRLALLSLAVVLGVGNALVWTPPRREDYFTPTRLSTWLYARLPELYDPMPEIFAMRRLRADWDRAQWAIADEACRKVLIARRPLLAFHDGAPPLVVNCPQLDPRRVAAAALARFGRQGDREFLYLDRPGPELSRPPAAVEAPATSFGLRAQSERFTGPGWGHRDERCLWAKGERSEVSFAPPVPPVAGRQGLIVRLMFEVALGEPAQHLRVRLNGVVLREALVRPGEELEARLRLAPELLGPDNHLVLDTRPDTLRGWLGLSDDSSYPGLCLQAIEVEPAAPSAGPGH